MRIVFYFMTLKRLKELDGLLALIRFHNIHKKHAFNTIWISGMEIKQIEELVFTLNCFGYITIEPSARKYSTKYLLWITEAGMKFCQNGGFIAEEKREKMEKIKLFVSVIVSVITVAAAIAGIITCLNTK